MTQEKIYSNLCWYDRRNPDFMDIWGDMLEDAPEPRTNCHCDNCFYGCDGLALEIIRLTEELEK